MKLKPGSRATNPRPLRRRKRARVIAARSLSSDRPTRVWSLLLPPTFPPERK